MPRGKQRAVLALLATRVGRVVPADRLADDLWDGDPPHAASSVLYSYVSKLRRALGGRDCPLVTRAPGYVLDVPPTDVDAHRFEALVREVEHTPDATPAWVSAHLSEALALWRGPALADFVGARWADDEAARLDEVRLRAIERRLDAELAIGHHKAVVAEVEPLVAAYPLRERLCGQLMLGLYRSGRQAEALRAFSRLRTHLVDELGITPSPDLVRLEAAILQQHAALEPPARELPSGVVTFVLTDVEGSTGLWESDPDAMAVALARHDAVVGDAIREAGGTLLKSKGEGDSTFSVFVRATDAVAAAARLQRDLAATTWPAGLALRVRTAVHTGEPLARDGDYYGPAVNRAARLRAVAAPGQVVVSRSTAELVSDHLPDDVGLQEVGDRPLPGMARPERIFVLRPPGTEPPVAPGARPPLPSLVARSRADDFVGRRAELAILERAWERARAGERTVALVTGEAGVGKTSLVSQLAASAHAAGALVLAGHCDEGYGVPYRAFAEALAPLLAYGPAVAALDRMGELGAELGSLVPEVSARVPDRAPMLDADPGTARYRQFEAVTTWLARVCEAGEVMLVLDDLHWAASPTLLLVRHLVRADPARRLLVVATYRDTELAAGGPFPELLADLYREHGIERLVLTGLGDDDIAELLRAAGGGRADPDWPTPATILRLTGGNPFFVGELLLNLAESTARATDGDGDPSALVAGARAGHAHHAGGGHRRGAGNGTDPEQVPAGIREVVGRRLWRLDRSTRQTLELAAVLGIEFDREVVAQAAGPGDDRRAALDALDQAERARLVVPGPGGGYRFAHALVRDTIYAGLGTGRRLGLHAAVARVLESSGPAADLSQLSYHWWAALPLGTGAAEAESYARRAGDRAMSLLAYEEAATHFQRAIDAHERAQRDPDPALCELVLALGAAHAAAGRVPDAGQAFGRAAALGRQLGLPDYLARAALGFEGELVTGGEIWEKRRALLEEAREALGDCVSPLRVRVTAKLADVLAGLEPGPRVAALSREVLRTAVQLGDEAGLAAALHARHQALAMPAHAAERAELARRVVARSESAGATTWAMVGRLARLADLVELGDLAGFDAEFADYADAARELRRPHDLWRSAVMRAMRALFDGRLDEGAALADQASELGVRLQQPGAPLAHAVQVFSVWWHQGRAGELADAAQSWAATAPAVATWRSALGLIRAEAGDTGAARDELLRLTAQRCAAVPRDNMWLATLSFAAETSWLVGEAEVGSQLQALLAPHAAANVTVGAAVAFGAAGRSAGLAAASAGDLDAAVGLLAGAVSANRRMGSPLWEATAQHDLAAVLRRRSGPGDAERAGELVAAAGGTAERLDLRRLRTVADPSALAGAP
ncbi:MAG TPA: BTAD domain-containing putative transcriptional regulator [Acidimicrobiales bacterium]|nr:BTAD domain-containing putative transcriptional regulator [Acidimicrobiales bacterium]